MSYVLVFHISVEILCYSLKSTRQVELVNEDQCSLALQNFPMPSFSHILDTNYNTVDGKKNTEMLIREERSIYKYQ